MQRYRSDFFGKLREVLANRPGIQIVGDRFVFQSEVLFPVGSAELTPAGASRSTALAITHQGYRHGDPAGRELDPARRRPHRPAADQGRARSRRNWELSAARAITVVKLLIADGVPAEHLAATGVRR